MKKSIFSLLLLVIGGLYGYTRWVNQNIPTNLSIITENKRDMKDEKLPDIEQISKGK